MKRYYFLALLFILSSVSLYSQNVKIIPVFFKVLKSRSYYTGSGYYYPSKKSDGFVEVRLRIENNGSSTVEYNIDDILIEGDGEARKPTLILANSLVNVYKKSALKIKPRKYKERKLIYAFPLRKTPDKLIIKSYGVVSLTGKREVIMDTLYYDKENQRTQSKSNASYSQIYQELDNGKWASSEYYYPSRVLKNYTELKMIYPNKRDGRSISYYENGTVKERSFYANGHPTGEFLSYYESGTQKRKEMYSGDERTVEQYWNEEGEPQLVEGEGTIKSIYKNGNIGIEEIKEYKMTDSFQIRKIEQDTIYDISEVNPEFSKGMAEFYRLVSVNIKYPNEARRMGIEGRVYVQFVVNKKGKVEEVKVLKGIGAGCDKESERIILLSPKWIPGKSKGKAVKTRMILPLTFKLS